MTQTVVHNVFEINRVQFIGPWVEYLEAFVIHILISESLDVFFDELEISLVCLDRVAQVILINSFSVVSQERANGLDARGTLQILRSQKLIEMFLERVAVSISTDFKSLKNSHEDLLEAFQVPILVNDGVDDPREEDLLGFVGKQVHKVVHLVDCFKILNFFGSTTMAEVILPKGKSDF